MSIKHNTKIILYTVLLEFSKLLTTVAIRIKEINKNSVQVSADTKIIKISTYTPILKIKLKYTQNIIKIAKLAK